MEAPSHQPCGRRGASAAEGAAGYPWGQVNNEVLGACDSALSKQAARMLAAANALEVRCGRRPGTLPRIRRGPTVHLSSGRHTYVFAAAGLICRVLKK